MRGAAMSLALLLAAGALGPAAPAAPAGEPESLEPGLAGRKDVLFCSGFEAEPWPARWGLAWGPSPAAQGTLIQGARAWRGRSLRVRYPQGKIGGPEGGLQFLSRFALLGIPAQERCAVRYYVRFDEDFDFVKGGKLPGLVGGEANTGGRIPNGRDGFSARLMWRPGGKVVQYLYHPDQKSQWGDDLDWDLGGQRYFKPGTWHCVESEVQLNTTGSKDGRIRSWFDGTLALDRRDLRFRDVDALKIDGFYFSTFFGGGDLSWAPRKDEHASFDGFVIARKRVGMAEP
jgi:hypothetical protein